jgi:hypothetical protein
VRADADGTPLIQWRQTYDRGTDGTAYVGVFNGLVAVRDTSPAS